MSGFSFSKSVRELEGEILDKYGEIFGSIDQISQENTQKVLEAFHDFRVSDTCFAPTTGYGLDDRGRDVLDQIFAQVFRGEKGLVRTGLVNGTHAITAALFGALKPGQTLMYVTGAPYDTLHGVIGLSGNHHGSMKFYGIDYSQVDPTKEGLPDYNAIRAVVGGSNIGVVAIQRSRGYSTRKSLEIQEIEEICSIVREVNPGVTIFVDNCYGEFVETREPLEAGADLIAGSLIKNPGGGLAPCGGYIVGRADLVDGAASRMSAPGIGGEYGATLGNNRLLYQGLFMAPHTVAQAVKTAVFCAAVMQSLGFASDPAPEARRSDIIQMIKFGNPDDLVRFCRGIQRGAPVDSFVTPEPGDMPGYDCPVIMAAGAFIQGASIELSADGPLREPYAAYMQGGLTFESGRLGIMSAAQLMMDNKK